ncbi:hypothetical protein ACOMHN_000087 [Nucella lapillus]
MHRKCAQRNRKWSCGPWILLTLFPVCVGALKSDEQRLMESLLGGYNTAARPVYNAAHLVTVKFGLTLIHVSDVRLLSTLLENYHMYSRPVFNASETVVIKFGLTLVQISDMDEVNQVLTINVWLEQEWQDERLVWDPRQYNGLKILRVPCEKIWLPDIVLYNSADDYTAGFMKSKAMVTSSGNVFWPPPAKFRSSCKIDITYFPFDDQVCELKFGSWTYHGFQVCELKFGSWTYDGFQVDITNRSAQVDLTNYVYSGEWELIDVRVRRTEMYYACCQEPYPDVRFTIIIRRKTLYYLFNIIFPCLWLTILSLLGFWLPPDSGEKITLGITVLLAFSVFMLLIAESMPATSEFVPLIGIYLTVTMAMTSLSIILTVFVLQLHHVGPHQKRVPRWVWTLVVDILAPLFCLCHIRHRYRYLSAKLDPKPPQEANNHNHVKNAALGTKPPFPNTKCDAISSSFHAFNSCQHPKSEQINSQLTEFQDTGLDHLLQSPAVDFVSSLGEEVVVGRGPRPCNGTIISEYVSAAVQTSVQRVGIPQNLHSNKDLSGADGGPMSSPSYSTPPLYHPQNTQQRHGTKLGSPAEMAASPQYWKVSEEQINICGESNHSISSACSVQGVARGFIRSSSADVANQRRVKGEMGGSLSPSSDSSANQIRHAHIHQVIVKDTPQDLIRGGRAVLCTSRLCLHPTRTISSPEFLHLQPELLSKSSKDCTQGCLSARLQQTCVKQDAKIEDRFGNTRKDFRATFSISEGLDTSFSRLGTSRAFCELTVGDGKIVPGNNYCSATADKDCEREEPLKEEVQMNPNLQMDYQDVVAEWRVVAHVMDRLLFWFFLLISVVSSILILIVKPFSKPEEWRES